MSRFVKFAPALAAITFALTASAGMKSSGEVVTFKAVGTAPGLSIDGKGDKLTVVEKDGKIIATASLCNLDTKMSLRNKHTREYLKVDCSDAAKNAKADSKDEAERELAKKWANRNAVLTVDKSKITIPADGKSSSGNATGKFTIAGATKDQAISYEVKNNGGSYDVKGTIKLLITDYTGGDKPSYLGVGVDPNIVVTVSFKLKDG
jgi:hypothetical protein